MRGLQSDSAAASVLQDQLKEIRDRWNRLNDRVMELRLVLRRHKVSSSVIIVHYTEDTSV